MKGKLNSANIQDRYANIEVIKIESSIESMQIW